MNTVPETAHDLRKLPCLSGLKEDELSVIGRHAQIREFRKHQIIFEESDTARYIYVVRTGRIKLFKSSAQGRELVIKMIGPQEYFCCAPIYHERKYHVSAAAEEDSVLVVIPTEDFREMIGTGVSEMGLRIIAGLCSRIKYLSNLVENLSFKDVEQRVISTLLQCAKETSSEDNLISLSLSHQDIASMTGTVREVVSRAMSKLKKKKIITDSSASGFTVDKHRLSEFLNE